MVFTSNRRGRMLLTSSGWRPRMLLNILRCTGQLPITKNYLAPNISSSRLRNLVLKDEVARRYNRDTAHNGLPERQRGNLEIVGLLDFLFCHYPHAG